MTPNPCLLKSRSIIHSCFHTNQCINYRTRTVIAENSASRAFTIGDCVIEAPLSKSEATGLPDVEDDPPDSPAVVDASSPTVDVPETVVPLPEVDPEAEPEAEALAVLDIVLSLLPLLSLLLPEVDVEAEAPATLVLDPDVELAAESETEPGCVAAVDESLESAFEVLRLAAVVLVTRAAPVAAEEDADVDVGPSSQ